MFIDPDANRRTYVFESSLGRLQEAVELTERFVAELESDEDFIYNIVMLASEAVTNAIEHGNGMDEAKSVTLMLDATPRIITVSVEDQGDGFDPADVPDPLASENLLEAGGRGLYLMQELADEVAYEADGRRIVMRFHRPD